MLFIFGEKKTTSSVAVSSGLKPEGVFVSELARDIVCRCQVATWKLEAYKFSVSGIFTLAFGAPLPAFCLPFDSR